MMYALYRHDYECGEFMDVSMVACADSVDKLIAYYEQIKDEKAEVFFEEADYGYAARWIIKDSDYRIQEIKAL